MKVLVGCLLWFAAVSGLAQAPSATKWQRNPITLPVSIKLTDLYAATNTNIRISLADANFAQKGYNCDEATNAAPVTANLKPRQEYILTVMATNLSYFSLDLDWKENWTPLTRRARTAKPKTYKMLVNRFVSGDGMIANYSGSGACDVYSNSWTIELVERIPANWRLEDGSDDPSFAAGDGAWAEIGPGRSQDKSKAAYSWSVSLGRLLDGGAAGRLTLRENAITPNVFTATNLYYTTGSEPVRDQVLVITQATNSPVLRQLRGAQAFVDIVTLTNASVEMRFYQTNQVGSTTNSSGHYTSFTGNPFVVWAVVNPSAPGTNEVQIVERRNGLNRTNQIVYNSASSTDTWVLRYGTGSEQRVEKRGVVISTSPTTNRVETVDIRYDGAASPTYHAIETYSWFPWGFELTRTETDPDGNPATTNSLVTTMDYYTDPLEAFSYGRLKSTVHPDGYWEKRVYQDEFEFSPGALWYVLRPNKNYPSNPGDAGLDNSVSDFYNPHQEQYSVGYVQTYLNYANYGGSDPDFPYVWVKERLLVTDEDYDDYLGYVNYSQDMLDINEDGAWSLGNETLSYLIDDEYGYSRQPLVKSDSGRSPLQSSFYQGGTYNSTNRVFTPGTNSIADGPQWRKSTIFGGYNQDAAVMGEDEGTFISMLEGEAIYPINVYTNQSWKEVEVFQNGNLALREKYVLTALTGNGTNEAAFSLVEQWVFRNDSLGHATNVTWIDGSTGVSRTIYQSDYRGAGTYDADLKLWEVDEIGIKTTFTYDSLKRIVATVKEGISAGGGFPAQAAITNSVSLDAQGRTLTNALSSTGLTVLSSVIFDRAGRPTSLTETNGLVTTVTYDFGGRKTTKTLPSGSTEITENYLDRRLASLTGTAVVNEFHDWRYVPVGTRTEPDNGRVQIEHTIRYATTNSARYRLEGIDWCDFTNRIEVADWSGTNKVVQYIGRYAAYNALPDFVRSATRRTEADLSIKYDFAGRTNALGTVVPSGDGGTGITLGASDQLSPISSNRITRMRTYFTRSGTNWFESTTNFTYRTHDSGNITILSVTKQRLNGFSSGNTLSEITQIDADTNSTVVVTTVDRANKRITEVMDVPQSTLNATNITVNGLLQWSSSPTVAQPVRFGYDSLGRNVGTTNTLGFVSTTSYNVAGQISAQTDTAGIATSFTYHGQGVSGAGQVASVSIGGKAKRYSYTARGEVYRIWGDVPYPEERIYSNYGEMTELRTFRAGSGWNGASWPASPGSYDKTTWAFQESTGLLTNKTDNANKSVTYTYWQGLLKTRSWARGSSVTTNIYNNLGELVGIDYSDAQTPDVRYVVHYEDDREFTRTGLPPITADGSGVWVHTYDHADRLISSTCTNGLFNGVTITNHFNGVYGRDAVKIAGISPTVETRYGWDTYGRLNLATNGLAGISYGYATDTDLIQTVTSRYNSSSALLTSTRYWDFGSRLREVRNVSGGVDVGRQLINYDSLNRRTGIGLKDGSYWSYDYDDRDQVVGGKHYWNDGTPVAGQQFDYQYDNLGNRLNSKSGGNDTGGGQRTAYYDVNALNQYSKRHYPSTEDVIGVATAPATVSVNGSTSGVLEKEEYFWKDLTVTNSSAPAWTPVWVTATQGSSVTTSTNYLLSAPTNQVFSYDADGNLTNDSLRSYVWNSENRLVTVETLSTVTEAGRRKVELGYDHQGRRTSKKSYVRSGGAWVLQTSILFVNDGWQLLAELNSTNKAPVRAYAQGLDLSGTLASAGGIGGLGAIIDVDQSQVHFPFYDGNGNVSGLVRHDSVISAEYEYGPFGEPLRKSGTYASRNPITWSTKYSDSETDLIYYGFRYYSPSFGRWISRDPIEEGDGVNIYRFVGNSPLFGIDPDGRSVITTLRRMGNIVSTAMSMMSVVGNIAAGKMEMPNTMINRMRSFQDKLERFHSRGTRPTPGAMGGKPPRDGYHSLGSTPPGAYDASGVRQVATGFAESLGMITIEVISRSIDGVLSAISGDNSSPEARMFTSIMSGAGTAQVELDGIDAALNMTGGAGAAATTALFVFEDLATSFQAGGGY